MRKRPESLSARESLKASATLEPHRATELDQSRAQIAIESQHLKFKQIAELQ